MERNMTDGKILRILLSFTIPLFIGNLFQQIYNTVDTMIVGRYLGENALAAVGSTGTLMFMIIGLASGLSTGFTVLVSQKFGEGNEEETKRSVANGALLSVIVVVVLTVLSLLLLPSILTWMNTPDSFYQYAYDYMFVICVGIVASVAYNYLASCLRAIGNSIIPLVMLVISAILNIVLDLLFIAVFGTGVEGAAWATVISQGVSAVLCLLYILIAEPQLQPMPSMFRLHRSCTGSQLKVGIPMALQFGITGSGTVIMQAAINLFGATAVAAYSAANKITMLMIQGPTSLGQTMATFAGQNFGARQIKRIKQGGRYALIMDVIYAVVSGLFVYVALPFLMGFFFEKGTDLTDVLVYAKTYIVICVSFYIPLSVIFTFRNTMQGCGYGFLPMMGGVVELVARLTCAVISMQIMSFELACFCDSAAWLSAGIFTMISYLFVIKQIEKKSAIEASSI